MRKSSPFFFGLRLTLLTFKAKTSRFLVTTAFPASQRPQEAFGIQIAVFQKGAEGAEGDTIHLSFFRPRAPNNDPRNAIFGSEKLMFSSDQFLDLEVAESAAPISRKKKDCSSKITGDHILIRKEMYWCDAKLLWCLLPPPKHQSAAWSKIGRLLDGLLIGQYIRTN